MLEEDLWVCNLLDLNWNPYFYKLELHMPFSKERGKFLNEGIC